jgi:hypothetical protein
MTYPSLTPMYSLGTGSRTGAAVLIGSNRSAVGSQARIYNYEKKQGNGQQYICFLIKILNPNNVSPCGY